MRKEKGVIQIVTTIRGGVDANGTGKCLRPS
jgi:hypothetical protein